jgi:succinate dehydrogenase / fumarate reductase cytochrome b subunit
VDVQTRTLPRRLHAISGLVPVGAFLVLHVIVNASALRGAAAYEDMVRRLRDRPLLLLIEIVLILVPILYHGLYGLYLVATRPTGDPGDPTGRRRLARFQRATGVPVFVFLLFHMWTTRLVGVRQHDHAGVDLFHWMQALLANPWARAAYSAGLLAATAHFSAGLWLASEDWGVARTRPARVAAGVAAAGVFVALSTLGLRTLAAFRL